MSPEMEFPVVASSNNDMVDNLKSVEAPRWVSNPLVDDSPTVNVTVSKEDNTYIKEVLVSSTQNVYSITIKVVDRDGEEVRIKEYI